MHDQADIREISCMGVERLVECDKGTMDPTYVCVTCHFVKTKERLSFEGPCSLPCSRRVCVQGGRGCRRNWKKSKSGWFVAEFRGSERAEGKERKEVGVMMMC